MVDLGESVDDLAPALRGRFGGISDDAVRRILVLAAGIPRKLEQIMEKIGRCPV